MTKLGSSRVQARGQITLPKSVRNAAGVRQGDLVLFRVVGPARIEIQTIPVRPLSYFLERFRSDDPYDEDRTRAEWQADAADEEMRHSVDE